MNHDPPRHMKNSVFVGGNAENIQNAADGGKASFNQVPPSAGQREIRDLLSQLRAMLDESRSTLAQEDADIYTKALNVIETESVAAHRNGFSIRGAVEVLAGAAGVVSGWVQAVTALRHALGL